MPNQNNEERQNTNVKQNQVGNTNQGFPSMKPEDQKYASDKGGKAGSDKTTADQWNVNKDQATAPKDKEEGNNRRQGQETKNPLNH